MSKSDDEAADFYEMPKHRKIEGRGRKRIVMSSHDDVDRWEGEGGLVVPSDKQYYTCEMCDHEFDPIASRWLCPFCHHKADCCEGSPLYGVNDE